MTQNKKTPEANGGTVTLKSVAAHVGLSPGTVSAVLNDAPSAKHIPKSTRERIIAAAQKLDYRPNFFAQSLRRQRTFTIGVIAHEIGDGYSSTVIAGIEDCARQKDYFFALRSISTFPTLYQYLQLRFQDTQKMKALPILC